MIDMTIAASSACGCANCGYMMRCVGAELGPGGDPTNIINWTNAYDITTVPWGNRLTGYFSDPGHTSPDNLATNGCTSGIGYPENFTQCVGWNPDYTACVCCQPCSVPTVYKSQFYLPLPTAYYVIAYGTSINISPEPNCGQSVNWFARGCIYPQQSDDQYPMIVDLPIPDPTMDDTIQVQQYWLGIIQPGASLPPYGIFGSGNMSILPDLASLTPTNGVFAGFGSSWNPSQTCDAPPDDPFTGAAEWP